MVVTIGKGGKRGKKGFYLRKEGLIGGALRAFLLKEADGCVSIKCGSGFNNVYFPGRFE